MKGLGEVKVLKMVEIKNRRDLDPLAELSTGALDKRRNVRRCGFSWAFGDLSLDGAE